MSSTAITHPPETPGLGVTPLAGDILKLVKEKNVSIGTATWALLRVIGQIEHEISIGVRTDIILDHCNWLPDSADQNQCAGPTVIDQPKQKSDPGFLKFLAAIFDDPRLIAELQKTLGRALYRIQEEP